MLPTGWELIAILAVLVLLFGTTKLPKLAKSLGQSAREFRKETRGLKAEEEAANKASKKEQAPELSAGSDAAPQLSGTKKAEAERISDKDATSEQAKS